MGQVHEHRTFLAPPAAEADRGRHPGFPSFNVIAGGLGSFVWSFGGRGHVRYEPIEPVSRQDAKRAATSAEAEVLLRTILAVALHDDDLAWAQAFCERFVRHLDPRVRGSALLGFGHLARRFRKLDAMRVQPLLEAGLDDPDAWVRGQTESAADDVEFFLGWKLHRP